MNRESKYWRNRANLRMDEYHKSSDYTISLIIKAYEKAMKQINDDIYKIFYKFMKDGRITEAEARELLNSKIPKKDLDDIRNRINQIQDDDLRTYMMAELNSEAYKARITRAEALKESIYISCMQIADVEIQKSNSLYINNINEAYYRNIYDIQKGTGIAFDFATMPTDIIEEILKNNWSGKHFSERVWKNTDVLAEELTKTITSGLMAGTNSRKMATEIQYLSEYGKHAAERLIRTETTYITNMSEIQSYKECDIDKYVFVATLDLRTSKVCREHDKKIYEVSKAVPGENLPPLHPYCRSTTIAYRDKETLDNLKRRARDPKTGKTYVLPKNMSYDEWYKKYVVEKYGSQEAEKFEKIIKNKALDKKQYQKYKQILGDEVPKSFDKFQELKYNNAKEYEDLKTLYKDVNWQVKSQENIVTGSEHKVPFNAKPNSVFDNYKNGKLESRRYYGNTGKPRLDIDLTDHGNASQHKTVPHQHNWLKDESNHDDIKRPKDLPLTKAQIIANKDILKGD